MISHEDALKCVFVGAGIGFVLGGWAAVALLDVARFVGEMRRRRKP